MFLRLLLSAGSVGGGVLRIDDYLTEVEASFTRLTDCLTDFLGEGVGLDAAGLLTSFRDYLDGLTAEGDGLGEGEFCFLADFRGETDLLGDTLFLTEETADLWL